MLHRFGFVTGLRRARKDEIEDAKLFMHSKSHPSPTHSAGHCTTTGDGEAVWSGPVWDMHCVMEYMKDMGNNTAPCLMVVDGFVIDATSYMKEHVGSFPVMSFLIDNIDVKLVLHVRSPAER